MAAGLAVPEADRDVFKKPIHHSMKEAIQGIPYKDENGDEIVPDVDQVMAGTCGLVEQPYKSFVCPTYRQDIEMSSEQKMISAPEEVAAEI